MIEWMLELRAPGGAGSAFGWGRNEDGDLYSVTRGPDPEGGFECTATVTVPNGFGVRAVVNREFHSASPITDEEADALMLEAAAEHLDPMALMRMLEKWRSTGRSGK